MNPLDEPIRKLFGRLNFLNFLIHFLEGRISKLQNEILEQLEQNTDSPLGFPFHGTSLLITDLTGPTDNGWLYHHVTGRVSVEKKEYIEMLGWFVSREAALAVAQSYETFETYLYDVSAAFLGANQDTVDISAFKTTCLKTEIKQRGSQQYEACFAVDPMLICSTTFVILVPSLKLLNRQKPTIGISTLLIGTMLLGKYAMQ